MKKLLILLLLPLFFSSGLIGQTMNNQIVVYEDEEQFKPIIMKTLDMLGESGALADGFIVTLPSFILPDAISSNNDYITPEYLKFGKDLSFVFDGNKVQPGVQNYKFKRYQTSLCNNTDDKFVFFIEDAKRIEKDRLIVCGRMDIERQGKRSNYAGFAIHVDLSTPSSGINDIIFFHNLETVNSVEIIESGSWIFCGTTKPGTYESGTNGIIFRISAYPPYNCQDYRQNWSYIFVSNSSLAIPVINNTSLNKIKPIPLSSIENKIYGVIGTTNENLYEADILFITIDANGKVFGSDIWGRPYDSRTRTAYKEYGKSFISDMKYVYPLGRYLEQHNPNENPTVLHDDILVFKIGTVSWPHFLDLIWANRYEMYTEKDYPDIPEDIILSGNGREPLAVLGNVKYSSTNYTGFILDLIDNGIAHDLTIFGDEQSGVDMLYSITKSYNNTLVAAGISNSFSSGSGTESDLWLVENYFNDKDTCYSFKRQPSQQKIELKKIMTKYTKITLEMSCCELRLLNTDAKDEMICDNDVPPPPDSCLCEEKIHILPPQNIPSGGDTCRYTVPVKVDTCKGGELSQINGVQFVEMNGYNVYVIPPSSWTYIASVSMPPSKYSFHTPGASIYPGIYNFDFYFDTSDTSNCRNIIVNYVDFSDNDVPRIICQDTIEICCPPCPTIEDVKIRCDSLYNGQYPTYEFCVDVLYYGSGTPVDLHVDYDIAGMAAGGIVQSISTPGTICFDVIDYSNFSPGTPVYITTYLENAAGYKYCRDKYEVDLPDCCPDYGDISVKCAEMTADGQSYNVSFNVTNNWLSPAQLCVYAYPPAITAGSPVSINPGTNTVNLQYTDESGIGPGGIVNLHSCLILGQDTVCSHYDRFHLPKCDSTGCNIFINQDTCCCYTIKAINPAGKNLQQAELTVYGGNAMNFTNYDGCASTSTPMPASNIIWSYSPACSPMFWNYICFQSNNSSGEIISSWLFTYEDGSTCTKLDTMTCLPMPEMSCDTITFTPIPDDDEQEEIIRFNISNNKVPLSPICKVSVNYVPNTMSTTGNQPPTSGGAFSVNGAIPGTDADRWRLPYHDLLLVGDPNYVGNDRNVSYGDYFSFNIGMNYFDGYSGVLHFEIVHCDGTKCYEDFPWTTHNPSENPIFIVDTKPWLLDTFDFGVDIVIKGKDNNKDAVSFIGINTRTKGSIIKQSDDDTPLDENTFKLLAISGSVMYNGEKLSNNFEITRQGVNTATFKLLQPIVLKEDEEGIKINLVYSGKMPEDLSLFVTLYDENAMVLGKDSVQINKTNVVKDSDGHENVSMIQIGKTYPNPAQHNVSIDYYLLKSEQISIDLIDLNGKLIKSIDKNYGFAGKNTVTFDTYNIPNGDYYIRFRTSNADEAISKIVIIK